MADDPTADPTPDDSEPLPPPADPAPPKAAVDQSEPPEDGDDGRIRKANEEAKRYRLQARAAQEAQQAAEERAATLDSERTSALAERDELATRLAVTTAAYAANADPELVIGYLGVSNRLGGVTPEDIPGLVAKAIEEKPALAAGNGPGPATASGGDFGGDDEAPMDLADMDVAAFRAWRKRRQEQTSR